MNIIVKSILLRLEKYFLKPCTYIVYIYMHILYII